MQAVSRFQAITLLMTKLEGIATLSDEERDAVQSLPISIRTQAAGQDIVRDGEKPPQCCLLVGGWAFGYKLVDGGQRQILSFYVPGDLPDLQSLHLHTMDHSVATLTNASLAFIPRESLRELIRSHPGLVAALWRETLIDAATMRAWIVGLGRRSAYGRIAHLFCELYLKLQAVGLASDLRCPWPMTQSDLSDAVGLSTIHANRVLQKMRGGGLITLRSGSLVIEAWDELVRAAAFKPLYMHLKSDANS